MGFRSYIREFLGAILMLFRPSLPWGFAGSAGSLVFDFKASQPGAPAVAGATGGKSS